MPGNFIKECITVQSQERSVKAILRRLLICNKRHIIFYIGSSEHCFDPFFSLSVCMHFSMI